MTVYTTGDCGAPYSLLLSVTIIQMSKQQKVGSTLHYSALGPCTEQMCACPDDKIVIYDTKHLE
jgi:hypothetical protein